MFLSASPFLPVFSRLSGWWFLWSSCPFSSFALVSPFVSPSAPVFVLLVGLLIVVLAFVVWVLRIRLCVIALVGSSPIIFQLVALPRLAHGRLDPAAFLLLVADWCFALGFPLVGLYLLVFSPRFRLHLVRGCPVGVSVVCHSLFFSCACIVFRLCFRPICSCSRPAYSFLSLRCLGSSHRAAFGVCCRALGFPLFPPPLSFFN